MVTKEGSEERQTWHYGLVARWWAEFETEGPEIDYFRTFVEAGQPALDVACGTGRLLIPFLRAGLDVDGCDISADMIVLCRERAEREGLSPTLRVQAMHELDMPTHYRTIYVCGGFGLGASLDECEEALRRMHEHLEPGGTLVLDIEPPWHDDWAWPYWANGRRAELPEPWPDSGMRRTASDGTEYELRARIVDIDPFAQGVTMEMRGHRWRDGSLIDEDERAHVLSMTEFFPDQLRAMLERAGFPEIEMRGDHSEEEPNRDTASIVFIARKPEWPIEGVPRR
jgi:SAM-dependent methyltransferase